MRFRHFFLIAVTVSALSCGLVRGNAAVAQDPFAELDKEPIDRLSMFLREFWCDPDDGSCVENCSVSDRLSEVVMVGRHEDRHHGVVLASNMHRDASHARRPSSLQESLR